MAKTNGADTAEKADGGDAPLIDLNDASLKKLIARAKKRGYLTYDELNDALPQGEMSSDQIEDITSALSEMGINIVENEEAGVADRDQRGNAFGNLDPHQSADQENAEQQARSGEDDRGSVQVA